MKQTSTTTSPDTKQKKKPRKKSTPNKLTKAKVIKAIPGSIGIVQVIADRCGVARQNMHEWFKKNPEVDALRIADKESLVDVAEAKLLKKVNEEEMRAIEFTLRTMGKNRGYVEKIEQENINVQVDTSVEEWERRLLKIKEK